MENILTVKCKITPTKIQDSLSDYIVTIVFADKSTAAITFSAKGYISEGVSEILNLQRGDLIANLTNFETLNLKSKKNKLIKPFFRDHGHRRNIINSYLSTNNLLKLGESLDYIDMTARLFLSIKDAIDNNSIVTIE